MDIVLESGKMVSAALAERSERGRLKPKLEVHNISLVRVDTGGVDKSHASGPVNVCDTSCIYVRWENVATRQARPVRIDENNKVVCQFYDIEPYRSAKILITNTSAAIWREKKRDRCALPDWVVTVQRVESAWAFAGPLMCNEDLPSDDCVACCTARRVALDAEEMDLLDCDDEERRRGELFQCHSCLHKWHPACDTEFAECLGLADDDIDVFQAHECGTSFRCSACASISRRPGRGKGRKRPAPR